MQAVTNNALEQLRQPTAPVPDIYGPDSPGFVERSQPFTSAVLTGGNRVDIGKPVPKQD